MTLPKGWKAPEASQPPTSQMPRLSLLSRPMVGLESLRVRGYVIKAMEMIEQETGTISPTTNLNYFEVQPIELTHLLVFTDGRSKQGQSMYIQDISDIKVSSFTKGRFNKKEDLIIEIRSLGPSDRKQYITRIDIDDKYADEIVKEVKSLKQVESDSVYWTHRLLTFTNQYGQKNTVDIYPLTPFLATGEEILWQIPRSDVNDKNKKVIWLDVVTNFRVFQYNYLEHKGAVILFPSVEDVRINNELRGTGFGEYNTASPYLTGIQPSG